MTRWRRPRLRPGNGGSTSLRRRLVWQFLILSVLLIAGLLVVVGWVANRASQTSQDAVLGAAVTAIAEGVRSVDEGVELELPFAAFSMLGAMGNERIFYAVHFGDRIVTGYEGMPEPPSEPEDLAPVFWTADYRDIPLRLAAVTRTMPLDSRITAMTVTLGQTRHGQAAIARETALGAMWVALGFLALALPVALLAAQSVLLPVRRLAEVVARRGPRDLSPVRHPAPRELAPLVRSLNGLIARLRLALRLAETFIFEAAHRIRTPLSLVRTEAELALSETRDEATRLRLRRMVRAIDESSRSAGQILDHAMVKYRSDQFDATRLDLARLASSVLRTMQPLAEMRDIAITQEGLDHPCFVHGDERMLEIALRNILDNAIKYTRPEGNVALTLHSRGTEAVLEICDDGRGFADEPAQLVDRFRRGGNVADVSGSGLGLTIVSEVATAHYGRFGLTPRKEGGACATFTLPLA